MLRYTENRAARTGGRRKNRKKEKMKQNLGHNSNVNTHYIPIPCNFVGISMSYLGWAHSGSNQFSICSINFSNICRCHCFSFCLTNEEHTALYATCYTHTPKRSFECFIINFQQKKWLLLSVLFLFIRCYLVIFPNIMFSYLCWNSLSFCPKVKPPNMHLVSKHRSQHSDYFRIFSTTTSKLFMQQTKQQQHHYNSYMLIGSVFASNSNIPTFVFIYRATSQSSA